MMPGVSQSYSSNLYASNQNNSLAHAAAMPSGGRNPSDSPSAATSASDQSHISPEGRRLSLNSQSANDNEKNATRPPEEQDLSQEELNNLVDLQKRDAEVRAHEQAHLAAAGQYAAGGASYSYVTGPNGKRYANAGEVPIDISKEKTPEATIQKARTIRRAALAPANPSGADRSIAAQASSMEAAARKELQEQEEMSVPTIKTDKADESAENTATPPTETNSTQKKSDENSSTQISTVSRQSMTSAYQAIAALAA